MLDAISVLGTLAGKTPLHNAGMRGSRPVLEYLLSRGGIPLPGDILLSSAATTMRFLGKGHDLRSVAADDITEQIALDHP